jgi:hypothetical protein
MAPGFHRMCRSASEHAQHIIFVKVWLSGRVQGQRVHQQASQEDAQAKPGARFCKSSANACAWRSPYREPPTPACVSSTMCMTRTTS